MNLESKTGGIFPEVAALFAFPNWTVLQVCSSIQRPFPQKYDLL